MSQNTRLRRKRNHAKLLARNTKGRKGSPTLELQKNREAKLKKKHSSIWSYLETEG